MSPRLQLVNERFGRLVVKELAGVDHHSKTLWRCVCDCGASSVANSNRLQRGQTLSCGCLRRAAAGRRYGARHGSRGAR